MTRLAIPPPTPYRGRFTRHLTIRISCSAKFIHYSWALSVRHDPHASACDADIVIRSTSGCPPHTGTPTNLATTVEIGTGTLCAWASIQNTLSCHRGAVVVESPVLSLCRTRGPFIPPRLHASPGSNLPSPIHFFLHRLRGFLPI